MSLTALILYFIFHSFRDGCEDPEKLAENEEDVSMVDENVAMFKLSNLTGFFSKVTRK